jgi:hypothetical protein
VTAAAVVFLIAITGTLFFGIAGENN